MLAFTSITYAGFVFAWGLPSIPSAGGGSSVDSGALNGKSAALILKVGKASELIGDAQFQMLNAVGNEKLAQQLQAALDGAKSKPNDADATKVLTQEVNNASKELETVDLNSKMDKSKANKAVALASLNFGGAALLDGWALVDAQALSKDVTSAGPTAAMSLGPTITAVKFLLDVLPTQLSDLGTLSKHVSDYAKTNKIPLASQKDIQSEADSLKGQ